MSKAEARKVTVDHVRVLFDEGLTHDEMIRELKISRPTLIKRLRAGNMSRRRKKGGVPPRLARNAPPDILAKSASLPAANHPAIIEGRTMYPGSVVPPSAVSAVLMSGFNHHKIGAEIQKGKWRGFPVFTVTLEERKTCPVSCRHWRSCYGNNAHLSKRVQHGSAFEQRIKNEVAVLASRYPKGFAVRLHVLGDFYSVQYVQLWLKLIKKHKPLHVFGFTARWERSDPIAVELIRAVMENWDRFAIRFSNAPVDECATVSIEHPDQAPADAIVCPGQTSKTENCSSCAFCWNSKKRVAFVQH